MLRFKSLRDRQLRDADIDINHNALDEPFNLLTDKP